MPSKQDLLEWVNNLPDEGIQEDQAEDQLDDGQVDENGDEIPFDELPEDVQNYISKLREENEGFKGKKKSANNDAKKLRLRLKAEKEARQALEAKLQGVDDDDQIDDEDIADDKVSPELLKLKKQMKKLEQENQRLSKSAQQANNKTLVATAEKALLEADVQKKYIKYVKKDLLEQMNDDLFDIDDFIAELEEDSPEFFKAKTPAQPVKKGSTSSANKNRSGKKPKSSDKIEPVASRSHSHEDRMKHKKWLQDTFGVNAKPNIKLK